MNQRKKGNEKEDLACSFLESNGVKIIERNYRVRIGEIDIIASEGDVLCFIEVKYRNTSFAGVSEEAVNGKKQNTICRVSDYYRMQNWNIGNQQIRFDVIAINETGINWIKDAFPYCGFAYR